MRVKLRIWFADRHDLAIVTALAELGGSVGRDVLAARVSLTRAELNTRLQWLERFGYLGRESGRAVCYTVVRMPAPGDEHRIDTPPHRRLSARGSPWVADYRKPNATRPPCGTKAGYQRHLDGDEEVCGPCEQAR